MGHLEKRNQKDRLELPTRSILKGTLKFLPVLAEEEGFRLESKEMSYDFQAVVNAQVVGRYSGKGVHSKLRWAGRQLRWCRFAFRARSLRFCPLYRVSLVWCCISVRILTLRR